jgi:hypothetical protein
MNVKDYLKAKDIEWTCKLEHDDTLEPKDTTGCFGIATDVIQQIDIDTPCQLMDYLYQQKVPYYLSIKKRLPHFFVRLKKRTAPIACFGEGDYLCGVYAYVREDEVVHNADQPIPIFNFYTIIK